MFYTPICGFFVNSAHKVFLHCCNKKSGDKGSEKQNSRLRQRRRLLMLICFDGGGIGSFRLGSKFYHAE